MIKRQFNREHLYMTWRVSGREAGPDEKTQRLLNEGWHGFCLAGCSTNEKKVLIQQLNKLLKFYDFQMWHQNNYFEEVAEDNIEYEASCVGIYLHPKVDAKVLEKFEQAIIESPKSFPVRDTTYTMSAEHYEKIHELISSPICAISSSHECLVSFSWNDMSPENQMLFSVIAA